ncbi:MAG: glycogen/starch/alpha-glucan phosphorylase [Candidatus Omnitrophica bacterium]|nr:glycogen/starch/alpha-glucan phosphorylase [Candidatus Omnitrophota bacterium]
MINSIHPKIQKIISCALIQIFIFTSLLSPKDVIYKTYKRNIDYGLRVPLLSSSTTSTSILKFFLYSRNNSFSVANGTEQKTEKFTVDSKAYSITERERIEQGLDGLVKIENISGLNLTFTIRGPAKRSKLAEYIKEKQDLLIQAVARSGSLYEGNLTQDITIILADKYDYLAGGHRQDGFIVLNASDLEEMIAKENPILVSELIISLLSEKLAHERGGKEDLETEERIAQDSAHATRYAITHQPYAPRISEYINFLKKYTMEIKGQRDYLAYLKVMNRYEDMDWTNKFAPLVAERSVGIFHLEKAFSRPFLENIYSGFIKKGYTPEQAELAVGRIAQLTMAGGLGNIKRDLGESWREKGVDPVFISPLYGRQIKGAGDIDKSLVSAILETMGEPQLKFRTKIFNRDNINEQIEVDVVIYMDPFSPSDYWICCPEVFDGAYPDNVVYLAQQLLLYRKASLEFLKHLKEAGKTKENFLFSLSEVYTAFLVPEVIDDEYSRDPVFKDIFIHHYNHTVVAAGMPMLPEFLYKIIGIKEEYRPSIVQNGLIILADLIGQESDEITGCSLAHTDILRKYVMSKFKDKIPDNISKKNSEGQYINNWQGEEMQKVYEKYFLILEAIDDNDLFVKLDNDDNIREAFISDMLKAKERQRSISETWRRSHGTMLNPAFKIASQTRRVVPYKRVDIINAMLGSNKYRERIRRLDIGFLVGGRIFARNNRDYGKIQINGSRYLADSNPGYLAVLPDYNIFSAHLIYEGDDIVIMLSNEGQEAGPTSPSKGLVNGAIIIATPDGVIPELLIDFNEDPINGNGFRVEYGEPEIQNMVKPFLDSTDSATKERLLENGRNGAIPFGFNTSQGNRKANSAGLRHFFNKWDELINSTDIEVIYNPLEDYFEYIIGVFKGIDNAGEIIDWLTKIKEDGKLEYHEKYSSIRSFLTEILGYSAEPTVKGLIKAIESAGNALKDDNSRRRLFYNALKTGMLNANISTRQGPGLIELWEQGLERKYGPSSSFTAAVAARDDL